jgi:uncharacterized protein YqgV (UPF0045/DUF77 family)
MKGRIVTVEISMYPLTDEYKEIILDFIHYLENYGNIQVHTHAMSSYIQGPFEDVWHALGEGLSYSFDKEILMSNIIKIVPKDLNIEDGWLKI